MVVGSMFRLTTLWIHASRVTGALDQISRAFDSIGCLHVQSAMFRSAAARYWGLL